MKKLFTILVLLVTFLNFSQNKPALYKRLAVSQNPLMIGYDRFITQDQTGGEFGYVLKSNVLGSIPYVQITDKNGEVFFDIESARTYVGQFTNTVVFTNETFLNGVYKFTCPAGSDFSNAQSFCVNNLKFEDPFGLVISFGDVAFKENSQNNTLAGDCTFGDGCFRNASGNNIIKKLVSCGTEFALNYINRFDIDYFGTTTGVNLPADIFTTSNLCQVVTPYANKFIDSGNPDGDILSVIANMTNINSVVSYDGIEKNYYSYVALLSQVGINNPTVTVLENTFKEPIIWTRIAAGTYYATLTNSTFSASPYCITPSTPIALINGSFNCKSGIRLLISDLTNKTLELIGYNFSTGVHNGIFINQPIEIRVYY